MPAREPFDKDNITSELPLFTGSNGPLVDHANQVVDRVNMIGHRLSDLEKPTSSSPGGTIPAVVFTGLNGELAMVKIPGGTVELL